MNFLVRQITLKSYSFILLNSRVRTPHVPPEPPNPLCSDYATLFVLYMYTVCLHSILQCRYIGLEALKLTANISNEMFICSMPFSSDWERKKVSAMFFYVYICMINGKMYNFHKHLLSFLLNKLWATLFYWYTKKWERTVLRLKRPNTISFNEWMWQYLSVAAYKKNTNINIYDNNKSGIISTANTVNNNSVLNYLQNIIMSRALWERKAMTTIFAILWCCQPYDYP